MTRYKLTNDGVADLEKGGRIPTDLRNSDWQEYQSWLADDNKPEPMDPPPVLVVDENEEKIKAEIRKVAIASLIAKEGLSADFK